MGDRHTLTLPFIYFPELGMNVFGASYIGDQLRGAMLLILFTTVSLSQRQGMIRNMAAGNHMWLSFYGNLVWGIMAITGTYFLKEYGAIGRALAFTIAYVIQLAIFTYPYISRSICPKTLLLSVESFLIWLVIVASFGIGLLDIHPFMKLLSMLLSFTLAGFLFFSTSKKFGKQRMPQIA